MGTSPVSGPERAVLEALADAVIVADAAGTITGWLGAAADLFGYTAAEAEGRPLAALIPGSPNRDSEEVAGLGGAARVELVVRPNRRDGSRFTAAATVTAIRSEAGELLGTVALIKAMGSWLDPAEAAGPVRDEWHQLLGRIVREFSEAAAQNMAVIDHPDQLAELLVEQGRRMLPGTDCLLSIVPPDRQQNFQIVAGAGPWARRQVGREWPREGTIAGRSLSLERPIETVRLQETSRLRSRLAEGAIQTGRLLPLVAPRPLPDGRRAFGVLGFYRSSREYFTPYQRRLMAEFARLVSVALQRAELRRAGAESAARLQTGIDVALDLSHSLDPREVIGRLVRRAVAAAGADRATLVRLEAGEMVIEDAHDLGLASPAPRGRRLALEDVVAGGRPVLLEAVTTRRPVTTSGIRILNASSDQQAALDSIRHSALLPLVLADQVLAVLVVGRRADRPFGLSDLATLQLIGNVAVLAIRNAGLYADAREASRQHGDFLNMAAHELRTPLTVVSGYLSMLRDGSFGEPPASWREPVALLAEKAGELGRLIEDLLLASRLESGQMPTSVERLDLRGPVAAAVQRAQPRLALLGGELVQSLPAYPVEVLADRDHVARVLDNLINNALTYGRGAGLGWVRVVVEQAAELAVVAVEDRGPGIPDDMRERIFERFVRVEDWAGGTGLGLFISRELATRHGGEVVLDWSSPGRGTRFSLRLPRARR